MIWTVRFLALQIRFPECDPNFTPLNSSSVVCFSEDLQIKQTLISCSGASQVFGSPDLCSAAPPSFGCVFSMPPTHCCVLFSSSSLTFRSILSLDRLWFSQGQCLLFMRLFGWDVKGRNTVIVTQLQHMASKLSLWSLGFCYMGGWCHLVWLDHAWP